MLPQQIQNLVDRTPQTPKPIIQMFEEVLHSPVGCCIHISKPNYKSRFTGWEKECPAVADVFWKLLKENIHHIVTCTQQLSMA